MPNGPVGRGPAPGGLRGPNAVGWGRVVAAVWCARGPAWPERNVDPRGGLATVSPMLKLVLPKGSLEKATLELFEAADLRVRRDSAVTYKASIDDPRIESVRIL